MVVSEAAPVVDANGGQRDGPDGAAWWPGRALLTNQAGGVGCSLASLNRASTVWGSLNSWAKGT